MSRRTTLAWPLLWAYVALIVYASLYPFGPWRDQGIATWSFLNAPWPKYWGGFDVWANGLGYVPFGFLAALSAMRQGFRRHALVVAVLAGTLASLLMEGLQSYLPLRVPSIADTAFNALGALGGALTAYGLERMGGIDRWSRFRQRWFREDASSVMAWTVLWPPALLFPSTVCLGLGQWAPGWRSFVADVLSHTPWTSAWVPFLGAAPPMQASMEVLLIAVGLLLPCWLAYGVIRRPAQRVVLALWAFLVGVGVTALSAALTYGPAHTWVWLGGLQWAGLLLGFLLALLSSALSAKLVHGLFVLASLAYVVVINQAPSSVYFAHTLQTWEQGEFIRFHGLAQWLGWAWPYVALLLVLGRWLKPTPRFGR